MAHRHQGRVLSPLQPWMWFHHGLFLTIGRVCATVKKKKDCPLEELSVSLPGNQDTLFAAASTRLSSAILASPWGGWQGRVCWFRESTVNIPWYPPIGYLKMRCFRCLNISKLMATDYLHQSCGSASELCEMFQLLTNRNVISSTCPWKHMTDVDSMDMKGTLIREQST